MLDQNKSVYRTDFTVPKPLKAEVCPDTSNPEPKPRMPPPFRTIDQQTFLSYQPGKLVHVPFDLYWTPKPIVGTDPYAKMFKADPSHKPTRMTAKVPTLIAPAVYLQDVQDPEVYKTITDDLYQTDWRKSEKEAAAPCPVRYVPDSIVPTVDPTKLAVVLYPPLLPEKILGGKEWDSKNPRNLCNCTKVYWDKFEKERQKTLPNPRHYENLVDPTTKEYIHELVSTNNLRWPHDKFSQNYGGHVSHIAWNVPLQKSNLPIEHPNVSYYQAVTRKFEK